MAINPRRHSQHPAPGFGAWSDFTAERFVGVTGQGAICGFVNASGNGIARSAAGRGLRDRNRALPLPRDQDRSRMHPDAEFAWKSLGLCCSRFRRCDIRAMVELIGISNAMTELGPFEFNFYAVLARYELLRNHSIAFQNFFVDVGKYRWGPDFEGRRPQGPIGDKKCDGYRPSTRTVFQCYAPRIMDAKLLTSKIEEDFNGALEHRATTPMKSWILVHNDHDELPTTAHELISARARLALISTSMIRKSRARALVKFRFLHLT
jgi:hypothetical protein